MQEWPWALPGPLTRRDTRTGLWTGQGQARCRARPRGRRRRTPLISPQEMLGPCRDLRSRRHRIPLISLQGTLGPRPVPSLPVPVCDAPEAAGSAPGERRRPTEKPEATSPQPSGAADASTRVPAATGDWLPGAGVRPTGLPALRSNWPPRQVGRVRVFWRPLVATARGRVRLRKVKAEIPHNVRVHGPRRDPSPSGYRLAHLVSNTH